MDQSAKDGKIPDRGLASEEEKASRKRLAEEGDVPVLQGASGQSPEEAPGASDETKVTPLGAGKEQGGHQKP